MKKLFIAFLICSILTIFGFQCKKDAGSKTDNQKLVWRVKGVNQDGFADSYTNYQQTD